MEEIINIKDILPSSWFDKEGKCDVYVSAYHCLTSLLLQNRKSHIVGQIFETSFLIIDTVLEYQTINLAFKKVVNMVPQFESNILNKKTDQSVILFLFSKYNSEEESKILSDLQTARGLLSNIEGKNSNYWHISDYILHFPKGNNSSVSPFIKMPDLTPSFTTGIKVEDISKRLSSLNQDVQSRIKLGLRWVDSAEHENQSLDEFLKLWFAIETIAMPDTTNIKPLVNRLASIYNIDPAKAQNHFEIGKLFGLRSNIVHNGLNIGIHEQLNRYLKAIINDIIMDICNYPTNGTTEQVLTDIKFKKSEWMP